MRKTSLTLLQRLRDPSDSDAWERFVRLYGPAMDFWARKMGLPPDDAAELAQEVFAELLKKMPEFEYDKSGRFRGWLYTVTTNRCRDWLRRRVRSEEDMYSGILNALESRESTNPFEDAEFTEYVVTKALALMKSEFREGHWRACWMRTVEGHSASRVASELGMTVNSVHLANSRVLRRLREVFGDLLD